MLDVVAEDHQSGWLWCRSGTGREGRVPQSTLSQGSWPPFDVLSPISWAPDGGGRQAFVALMTRFQNARHGPQAISSFTASNGTFIRSALAPPVQARTSRWRPRRSDEGGFRAAGLSAAQLEVCARNVPAVRLYQGAGFVTRKTLYREAKAEYTEYAI